MRVAEPRIASILVPCLNARAWRKPATPREKRLAPFHVAEKRIEIASTGRSPPRKRRTVGPVFRRAADMAMQFGEAVSASFR